MLVGLLSITTLCSSAKTKTAWLLFTKRTNHEHIFKWAATLKLQEETHPNFVKEMRTLAERGSCVQETVSFPQKGTRPIQFGKRLCLNRHGCANNFLLVLPTPMTHIAQSNSLDQQAPAPCFCTTAPWHPWPKPRSNRIPPSPPQRHRQHKYLEPSDSWPD